MNDNLKPDASTHERYMDSVEAALFLKIKNFRTVTPWAREGYIPVAPLGEGKRRLWTFIHGDLDGDSMTLLLVARGTANAKWEGFEAHQSVRQPCVPLPSTLLPATDAPALERTQC
jgi:hypothetical protein